MTRPILLIVEETVQRVYRLDADDPDQAELADRLLMNPLEGQRMPFMPPHKPPALLGRRGAKGNRVPFVGVPLPEGGMVHLDPDAEHSVHSSSTLLHLDEAGKPFYQIKAKRTTVERGPVKP